MTDHIQILYIDDDQFLRDIVKQFLEREEGWMVTTAESAIDAIHLLTEKIFDAVVSDYEMEQMDGIELLKHLRKKGDTIPFIIFTGKGREEVVIDALNSGADFYLQKGGQSTTLFTELSNKILYAVSRRRAEKDLIESQKRIAEVIETLKIKEFAIESSLNGIAISDLSGILTYVNPGLLDIWGYSSSDIIIGKTWSDLWENEGDAKVVVSSIRETGRWSGELTGIRKDKKTIVLIVSANLIRDTSGVPIGMYGSFFDITEQKKIESDLIESRERFRQLAEVFPETIFEVDTGGTITYVNTHGLKQFCYTPEDISKNIKIYNLVSSEYRDQVFRRVQGKIQGIYNGYMEFQALRADGSLFWAMGLSVPIRKNGTPVGVRGFILDITSRKQSEEELHEVTDRLSLATRAGGVGIWDWDLVRNKLTWDDQMFRLYGISNDQYGNAYETWRAGFLPEDLVRCDNEIRMAISGAYEFKSEFRILWPDKSIHTIRSLALVQRDASGHPVRMIGTNWDITEVKLQEENIRKYSLTLEERNVDLEQVRKELATLNNDLENRVLDRTKEVEELLCHKDQFIEMVGHDLKTPLTPICALLPHLLKDEQNPESREIISLLIKDATFMREHIGKVLTLARLNRGSPLVDLKKLNVRKIVNEVMKSYHYSIHEKDLTVHNQVDEDLTLLMNSLHLEVVIRNILENAIKYSGNRGGVILSGVSDRDYITLSISDTGIGMSPDEIVFIFDEFYRADASRHERDSHGLGLSIVKRIVVLYQGIIHAESKGKGMGSTFMIRLPKKTVAN